MTSDWHQLALLLSVYILDMKRIERSLSPNRPPATSGTVPKPQSPKPENSSSVQSWDGPQSAGQMRKSGGISPVRSSPPHFKPVQSKSDATEIQGPSPRLDISQEIKLLPPKNSSSPHTFNYGSDDHGIKATLRRNGSLKFEVHSKPTERSNFGGGRDMFISLMRRIKKENLEVKSIAGEWLGVVGTRNSENLNQYVENLKTMNEKDAAINTWTGRLAADFGYTEVDIHQSLEENFGVHEAMVFFRRPNAADDV
jgi:hypothetical protein